MYDAPVPPMPPMPPAPGEPAPKPKRSWSAKLTLIIIGAIVLFAVGADLLNVFDATSAPTAEAATSTPFSPNPPSPTSEPEPIGCVEWGTISDNAMDSMDEFKIARSQISAFDFDGAAAHFRNAVSMTMDSAVVAAADPAVSDELFAAAEDYSDAAEALEDLRLERASELIQSGTEHVDNASDATEASTVPPC